MAEARESREITDGMIQGAVQALSDSLEEISQERQDFASQARRLKSFSGFFNVLIILLSVAAPIIVTYLTQQVNPSPDLILYTIIIVALLGGFATLRVVLRWGEKYGYAVMTAMKLRELESNARMDMEEILHTNKDSYVYVKLSALNRDVQDKWTAIIRRHLVSGGSGGEGSELSSKG